MNFRLFSPLLLTAAVSGEVLTLSNGNRFEGELLSIDAAEGMIIESPRSPEPLAFKSDSFLSLQMDSPHEADPFQTERLVLANGDILPGNLRSLSEKEIVYDGLVGGTLSLPRSKVNTLRFGIKPQSLTYQGPAPLSDWTGDGVDSWVMSEDKDDGLLLIEPGQMERDAKLGKQFRIQFHLKWQERPSVRIYFGAELGPERSQDRYYIDLNSGGLQIRRERSVEPRFRMLVNLSQGEAFDDNEVEVDLRVNRLLGTIDLYLDGKLVRQMEDTASPTTGDGIIIERKRSDNSASYLTNFKVYDWDAVSQLELLEDAGNSETDSIVDAEGKRISGILLALQKGEVEEGSEIEGEPHFLLASPFAEEPVEIPSQRTRIIYFKESNHANLAADFPKYEIELANDGLVSAKKISLSEDTLSLNHPLLGEVDIPRAAVRTIHFLNELPDDEE